MAVGFMAVQVYTVYLYSKGSGAGCQAVSLGVGKRLRLSFGHHGACPSTSSLAVTTRKIDDLNSQRTTMRFSRIALAYLAILLASCASQPRHPITYYEPPSEAGSPTLVGEDSLNSIVPLLFDNNTVFVGVVDGLPVRDPRRTGKEPLPIRPGLRKVVVAQRLGSFFGSTSLEFEVVSGRTYVIRHQQDLEGTNFMTRPMGQAGGPTFFWIEEQTTGKRMTEQVRVNVTTGQSYTPVPIFIPKGK